MPSNAVLAQKEQIVEEVSAKLQASCAGVVVDYRGITVAEDTALRKELREAGIEYFVVKNTMLGRAADKVGLSEMKTALEGTTAIALSSTDYTAAARILNKFAESKPNYFELKIGFIDNEVVNADKVKYLAKLPGKEGLIAKALGSLKAPIANLVYALDAVVKKQNEEQSA